MRRTVAGMAEGPARKHAPLRAFQNAVRDARAEEIVRGLLALILVGVLVSLVFFEPAGDVTGAPVASAKTLAIAVVAFYFGLHKGTPQTRVSQTGDAEYRDVS